MANIHTVADLGQERRMQGRGANHAPASMAPPPAPSHFHIQPQASQSQPAPVNYVEPAAAGDNDAYGASVSLMGPPYYGIPPLSYRLVPWFSVMSFTFFISMVQVLMFFITLIVGGVKFDGALVSSNSMGGPSGETFLYMGAKYYPDIRNGEVWRLVTPILLHGGFIHLVMNLFFQFRFGFALERRWGLWRFIAVYFLTGIGANFLSSISMKSGISVGASGALFGLIGAEVIYLIYNWSDTPDNSSEACMIVMLGIINFIYVLGQDSIDIMAHLGGFITGMFCTPVVLPMVSQPSSPSSGALYKIVGACLLVGWFLFLSMMQWVA
eukprot:TRINITY_DN2064_c0_g1_i1.p1 TRINITY_DN2064_c0_g1~~TRINITY_DN2064_c0_g1_i1.p1  ORF type:complete len:325 (-),score=38.94 TRINITY_DN2064_c0_g1_i1:372-1346(-)